MSLKKVFKSLFRDRKVEKLATKNQPCYDKDGNMIGWYSRSVAASLFAFCQNKDGELCVLASKRGSGSADFQGRWNCPCGYVDFNETTGEAAIRETFEETGVKFLLSQIKFFDFDDLPCANRQNITFHYMANICDKKCEDFAFSKKNNEKNEVDEIEWLPVSQISSRTWAFDHDKIIAKILRKIKRLHKK